MRTHITGFDIRIDTEVSEEHTKNHSDQVRSVDSLKKSAKTFIILKKSITFVL